MKSPAAIAFLVFVICLQLAVIAGMCFHPGRAVDSAALMQNARAALPQQQGAVEVPKSQPFGWAQIESPDYRTYVQNLRSIQCPEQTIRDIIAADVDANLFAVKRQKLRSREREVAGNRLGTSATPQDLSRAERDLWNEELSLIARILGQENPEQGEPASSITSGSPDSGSVATPSALAVSSTDLPGFSDDQKAALDRFRRIFVSGLDGLNPNAAEYAKQWQDTQPEVDAGLEAVLGAQAYQELKLEAWRKQLAVANGQN